jgi:ParB family chromosome partitioning protein
MAKEKGLGRGLGALFGEAATADAVDCVFLPLAKVESSVKQPRKHFDEVALAELAESIRQHGVLQPITARKLPSGSYQIIAGERRWRAARLAGLNEVPVRVIEADDRKAAELALVENLQREDLSPLEEAQGLRGLIDEHGFTQERAAETVGKSRSYVTNSLRLFNLSEEVRQLLEDGKISAGHAKVLLSIKTHAEQLKLAGLIVSRSMSVRDAEIEARKFLLKTRIDVSPARLDPKKRQVRMYLDDLASKVESSLGRRAVFSGNGSKGKLTLEYYSGDDLERLLEAVIKK